MQRGASGHGGHGSPGLGLAAPGAPRACSRAVLCQERELGLWDSGPFDVCCSQTTQVIRLSNAIVGFAVWLSACSGGSGLSVEATYSRGVWFLPALTGLWCSELHFEALSPFYWLLHQVNSNGSLDWMRTKWSLQILESCSRFKATAGGEKATNGCIARQVMVRRRENFWLRLPCGKQMLDNISFNLKTHQPASPCSICVSFWTSNWQLEKVIRKCFVYIPALATAAKLPISYSAQAFCLLS